MNYKGCMVVSFEGKLGKISDVNDDSFEVIIEGKTQETWGKNYIKKGVKNCLEKYERKIAELVFSKQLLIFRQIVSEEVYDRYNYSVAPHVYFLNYLKNNTSLSIIERNKILYNVYILHENLERFIKKKFNPLSKDVILYIFCQLNKTYHDRCKSYSKENCISVFFSYYFDTNDLSSEIQQLKKTCALYEIRKKRNLSINLIPDDDGHNDEFDDEDDDDDLDDEDFNSDGDDTDDVIDEDDIEVIIGGLESPSPSPKRQRIKNTFWNQVSSKGKFGEGGNLTSAQIEELYESAMSK